MIDEKKLIEDVLNTSKDISSEWETAGILNLIHKQPKVEWIPVSERLPEEGKIVIVTDRITSEVTLACLNIFDCFVFEDGRGHGASAWMTLPEPYKE